VGKKLAEENKTYAIIIIFLKLAEENKTYASIFF